MHDKLLHKTKELLHAYSSILFISDFRWGGIIFLFTFLRPNAGLAGVTALFFAFLFAKLIGYEPKNQSWGLTLYNSLLTGLLLGQFFQFGPSLIPLIAISSISALLLGTFGQKLLLPLQLPLLSLPASALGVLLDLATQGYQDLYSILPYQVASIHPIEAALPMIWVSYCKSLASILFVKNFLFGCILSLVLLFHSRILFLFSFTGFLSGVFFQALLTGSWEQALHNPTQFNSILVSMALGAVFLIPSLSSLALSLIGVGVTVLLTDGFKTLLYSKSVPVHSIPYAIAVILILNALKTSRSKWVSTFFGVSPEKVIEHSYSLRARFRSPEPGIFMPVVGRWKIYQGFKGAWTHRGIYQSALDFIVNDEQGKSFKGKGTDLEDYYAFGQPVVSPCSGTVVALRGDLPDCRIGNVNRDQNWGNYLIIRSALGFHVELSHLRQNSICVQIGQYIEAGSPIAECGNSGYSPQPHLHLQVQETPQLGDSTVPFHLIAYRQKNRLWFHSIPRQGEEIQSLEKHQLLERILLFQLGETQVFIDERGTQQTITTRLDEMSGQWYLEDAHFNRLYFWRNSSYFYFYDYRETANSFQRSILATLYSCAPRIPFSYGCGLKWREELPSDISLSRFMRVLRPIALFLQIKNKITASPFQFSPDGLTLYGNPQFLGKRRRSEISFDALRGGFLKIRLGNQCYTRCNPRQSTPRTKEILGRETASLQTVSPALAADHGRTGS